MIDDDIAGIIEIKDSEIDVKDIMSKIRAGIESRRSLYEEDVFFPSFNTASSPEVSPKNLSREFNYELQEAMDSHDQVWVSSQYEQRQIPLVGRALGRFRNELHNLVIFYANLLASKQVTFNAHSVRAIAKLSDMVSTRASAAEQVALAEEIQLLRGKVEKLENEVAALRTGRSAAEDANGR